jgi:hypothetical protein
MLFPFWEKLGGGWTAMTKIKNTGKQCRDWCGERRIYNLQFTVYDLGSYFSFDCRLKTEN